MPELYEITCPHCAKVYELPREKIIRHAGSKIQCKTCTGVFLMPALPDVEPEADKEPAAPSARQTPAREPAMAGSNAPRGARGTTSSEQTPWPFAFAADDDDQDDVKDVEVEASDEFSPSSSDSHFVNAALSSELKDEESIDDETIDVEHEPTSSRPTPQPRPTADRMNAVSGKLPVDAPFQKEEIAAKKATHNDRIERPAKKPQTPVSQDEPAAPAPAAPMTPIDPEVLVSMRADLRSIARWVRFVGWLFVLAILASITLTVLTYYGIIDWPRVIEFWQAGG